MPAVFNNEFSKTYADLLKSVKPAVMLDYKSELTDSEYNAYPGPIFSGIKNLDGIPEYHGQETARAKKDASNDTATFFNELDREEKLKEARLAADPELQFYKAVLERMRNSHKDVVSIEAVK